MDSLPDALLLQILSRLDDSADVARCRVAYKPFNSVYPGLRSIHLQCSPKWRTSRCWEVINDLICKLESVETVCIGYEEDVKTANVSLAGEGFAEEWLPSVSESLKSLSLSDLPYRDQPQSNILLLVSKYCHNLVNLELKYAWLSVENLNPMPMLTSLTLESIYLEDENLNQLNTCFPNLQVLNLVGVSGLVDPKIHLLNLKVCHWDVYDDGYIPSLTLITPNLITLKFGCFTPGAIHVEAPMLSYFHLIIDTLEHARAFIVKKFENLTTLWLDSLYFGFLLSKFSVTKTVEKLILDCSGYETLKRSGDSQLSLAKAFMVFPNVSSLCIYSGAWLELEAYRIGWEILDAGKALKTLCAYLVLVNPLLTFSYVACVLDQCGGLSEVSLLIHGNFVGTVSESFMSRCTIRWPSLKWRWGIWNEGNEDSWIIDGISI